MEWNCKYFDELTAAEMYAILQLRNEVFVVEQRCIFQDADNKDQFSFHLMCWSDNQLLAYTRLLGPGKSYTEASIGRVVTAAQARNSGLGKELMQRSINKCYSLFGKNSIKIGAQFYLKNFYSSLGFQQTSEIYLEDDIQHIEMILPAKTQAHTG
jgi:ElaA protein